MKAHEARDFLPLIKEWAEGATLQCRDKEGWFDVDWRDVTFTKGRENYRIKPTSRHGLAVCVPVLVLLCGCHLLQPDGEDHFINKPKWLDRNVYENLDESYALKLEAERTNNLVSPRQKSK